MIPRLLRSQSAVTKHSVLVAVLFLNNLINRGSGVDAFFHNQEPENIYAPINNAGLLINQLLVSTANFSSLLDHNIDHIRRPVGDYPSLEERSDYDDHDYEDNYGRHYLGSDFAVRATINCISFVS